MAFFGLTPKYRTYLHRQIFDLIHYGGGGFTLSDVYTLPIHLRNYYHNALNNVKKKESDEMNKINKKASPKSLNIPQSVRNSMSK